MTICIEQLIMHDDLVRLRGTYEAMAGAHQTLAALNRYVAKASANPWTALLAWIGCGWNWLLARRLERKSRAISRRLRGLA